MKIKILSRDRVMSLKEEHKDIILVSIHEEGHQLPLHVKKKFKSVLSLVFDDIETEINCDGEQLRPMSEVQGKMLKDFVDIHKEDKSINTIVVHCLAGISRSGAVGCVLERVFNGNDEPVFATGNYIPNKHVYKLCCNAFNLSYSEEDFKRKLKLRNKSLGGKINADYGISLSDMFCDVIVEDNEWKNI